MGAHMPKWVIPLAILLILILAMVYRWEKGPTQTVSKVITYTYKQDKWTGQNWVKTFSTQNIIESPIIPTQPITPTADTPQLLRIGVEKAESYKNETNFDSFGYDHLNPDLKSAVAQLRILEDQAAQKQDLDKQKAIQTRDDLTIAWSIITIAVFIWLLITLCLFAKQELNL